MIRGWQIDGLFGRWKGLVRCESPCRFLVLVPQSVADDFADWLQGRIGNRVVGRCAFGPPANDARTEENSKVLADIRLGGFDAGHEFAHAQFICFQERSEDREPRGIAQDTKPFRDMIEKLGGYKLWHERYYITIEL